MTTKALIIAAVVRTAFLPCSVFLSGSLMFSVPVHGQTLALQSDCSRGCLLSAPTVSNQRLGVKPLVSSRDSRALAPTASEFSGKRNATLLSSRTSDSSAKSMVIRGVSGLVIGAAVGGVIGYEYGKHDEKNCTQECNVSPVLGASMGAGIGGLIGLLIGLFSAVN